MDPADGEKEIIKKESRLQKSPFDETTYSSVSERIKYLQEQAQAKLEKRTAKSAANKVVSTEKVSVLREQVRENIELHVFRILRVTGREELLSEEERQLCVDLTQRLRETTHWRNPFIHIDDDQNLPPSAIEGIIVVNFRTATKKH
jgi:DNA replication initiation complex subunit (GINS family)